MKRLRIFRDEPLAIELTDPLVQNPQCVRCAASAGVENACLGPASIAAGSGPTLLVVFDKPVQKESTANSPFASSVWFKTLQAARANWRGRIVATYAVRCAAEIKPVYVKACRGYLRSVIDDAKPARILCVGSNALTAVTGFSLQGVDVRRGYTVLPRMGIPVFPIMPPYVTNDSTVRLKEVVADIAWACQTAVSDLPALHKDAHACVVEAEADLQQMFADLDGPGELTLDLETFGKPGDPHSHILDCAVTRVGAHRTWVVPLAALRPNVRAPILAALLNWISGKRFGGHNIKNDLVFINTRYGVRAFTGHDTMLVSKLLNADAKMGIEKAAAAVGVLDGDLVHKRFIEPARKKLSKVIAKRTVADTRGLPKADFVSGMKDIASARRDVDTFAFCAMPVVERAKYNAFDTYSSSVLQQHQCTLIADGRQNVSEVYNRITRDLSDAVVSMESNGAFIDTAVAGELQALMQHEVEESLAILQEHNSSVNWNFSPGILPLLRSALKNNKLASTDKDSLAPYAEHPLVAALIKYRHASKFKATYADGVLRSLDADGRVRCNIKIAGTESGRPSGNDPNLLNIPRPSSQAGLLCRRMFSAPTGRLLAELDFSQIELRVAADQSGDQAMLNIFHSGIDFHLATARLIAPIFKFRPEDIGPKHDLRSKAKGFNFSVLYGKTLKGLAESLGVSLEEATAVATAILGNFAALKRWINTRVDFTKKHGYTYTWWDGIEPFRQRPLPDIGHADSGLAASAERAAYNTAVQGTASDYMNASLGAIDKLFRAKQLPGDPKLILTVYDSMLIEVDEAHVVEVAKAAKSIMQSWPTKNGVPIIADVKAGPSWGDAKELVL